MKAFLILEDGHVFKGTSIGSTRDVISEIVFNTSMTGYLEVMTDPSYAGQAVCMTYPLIGNYGICYDDQESSKPWVDGFIVRELSRVPSNFRSVDTIQHFLTKHDIPGIAGIDTRALTKILREKGTMNGMITVNENYDLDFTQITLADDEYIMETMFDFGKVEKGFRENTSPTMNCKSFDTLKENDTFTNHTKTVGTYFGVTAEANSKWTTITHIPEEKHEVVLPRTGK